ncbi:UPF0256 protein [Actinobacteria bacterium OK074]|nr:UPF0256 protein [Actinobacteria bacterium OK074]
MTFGDDGSCPNGTEIRATTVAPPSYRVLMSRDHIDVRPIAEPDLQEWIRARSAGFLRAPVVSDEELANTRTYADLSRTLGAFDAGAGGRCVATFRSFAQEITAVGGAAVPADAISNVSVTATHRRRGLLTRMMAQDLAAAKERGDVVATLIAAEYGIYGRYGFGPATHAAYWTIDALRTGLDPRVPVPDDGGRIDLADAAEIRKVGPELHERLRRRQPGVVDRDEHWWKLNTGLVPRNDRPRPEPFYAVYRSASGEVDGLVVYVCDETWTDAKQPAQTATVHDLIAATPAAERALWHYLCSLDWITTVTTGPRAPDALLPHFFPDPRAARITTLADWLWVRILDVVRALEARTYGGTGTLVLEVEDPAGLAGGRFRLTVGADGRGVCEPVDPAGEAAQLVLGVAELGALWLGDVPVSRLVALGRVQERQEGVAFVADALLRSSGRPWCPDMF